MALGENIYHRGRGGYLNGLLMLYTNITITRCEEI